MDRYAQEHTTDAGLSRDILLDDQPSEARLARELARAELLQRLSMSLIPEQHPETLREEILDAAMALMDADASCLQLLEPDGARLVMLASRNLHPESVRYFQYVDAHHPSPCGRSFHREGRVIVEDVEASAEMAGTQDLAEYRRSGIRASQSTPLVSRSGKRIGLISTHWRAPRTLVESDFRYFDILARQLADLIERSQADAALRESEARYRTLFDSIDEGVCTIEVLFEEGRPVDYRFLEANPAFIKQTGFTDAVGRSARELVPALEAHWFETYGRIAATGVPERFEAPAHAMGRWYDVYAFRVGDPAAHRVALIFNDIAPRKHAESILVATEERQAFLLTLSDALRNLSDPTEAQEVGARVLGQHLGADHACYLEVDDVVHECVVEREWHRSGAPSHARRQALDAWPMAFLLNEKPWVIDDVATDPSLSDAQRESYRANGIAACVVAPVVKRGQVVAMLVVDQHTARAWTTSEVALASDTAERTWAAVERARAEAALRETQRRLNAALSTAHMAYWQSDPATGHIAASPSMDDVFGLLPGQRFESIAQELTMIYPDDAEAYRARVEEAIAHNSGWRAEFRIVRPRSGEVAWLEEVATVTRDSHTGRPCTTGLVWDITNRKRREAVAEIQRAADTRDTLRGQLLEAEEAERRRLALELHDETGQHLTALGLGLQALSDISPPGSEVDRRAAQLRALASTMGHELHAIAVRLRPRALDDFGLEAALVAYVEEWSRQTGIATDVHAHHAANRLPNAVESALYRVVQEALNNVARHSGATRASVIIERRDGHVVAIVEDDGSGFDAEAVTEPEGRSPGLGIPGMRERIALVGGTLQVETAPSAGTAIFVRVPITELARGSRVDA